MWLGEITEDDIKLLNTRLIGTNWVTLPEESVDADKHYVCLFNKQRNAASAGIFQYLLVSGECSAIVSNKLPPDHTILIKTDIQSQSKTHDSGKTWVIQELRDRIINTCGNSHVKNASTKKINPCLRLYHDTHAMCTDTYMPKKKKLGNGTLFRVRCMY